MKTPGERGKSYTKNCTTQENESLERAAYRTE
jgi:hypothetical protein